MEADILFFPLELVSGISRPIWTLPYCLRAADWPKTRLVCKTRAFCHENLFGFTIHFKTTLQISNDFDF